MLQKIKMLILSASSLLTLVAAAVPVTVSAQASIQGNLCQGAKLDVSDTVTGKTGCDTEGVGGFQKTLNRIINVISLIVGVVAVIMIIYGGFRYITSGGTSEKVTSAKNTILYGLIGLIIVALAQVIVKFVLKEASASNTGS